MRKIALTFISVLLSATLFAQSWTIMADMPIGKHMPAAVVIDTVIYVVGGYDAVGNATNTMHAYYPNSNTWATKPSMSVARGELAAAASGGKLYVIGGYVGSAGVVNTVEEYDPVTNMWTTKASMPTARSQFSVGVSSSGLIYCNGGYPGSYTANEVYNPATNTWATRARMPVARLQNNGAVYYNGKVYFIGGKDIGSSTYYDDVNVYTPSTDSWSTLPSMPATRFSGAIAPYGRRIFYMGGAQGVVMPNFTTNYSYDTLTRRWTSVDPLLRKRSGMVAVAYGNQLTPSETLKCIFLIGGRDSVNGLVAWNHKYVPSLDTAIIAASNQVELPQASLSVYPNPAYNGYFNIKANTISHEMVKVSIYDLKGIKIDNFTIETNSTTSYYLATPGIYSIIAEDGTAKLKQTIIVQ
ncbi:MAG: T9SS C-terminal target domain-containing protein [Chitinophagia bacterium]|nr:T9SS C-terminal target domain-containing protein [Chitinophagia bacterium]